MEELGMFEKIAAVAKIAYNLATLLKVPGMIKDLIKEVTSDLDGIAGAMMEMKKINLKLGSYGYQCSSKSITTPLECYIEIFGNASAKPDYSKVKTVEVP
jgi:hypothetical protein